MSTHTQKSHRGKTSIPHSSPVAGDINTDILESHRTATKTYDHALASFDQLPDIAYVRLRTVCGLVSCSPSSAWRYVLSSKLPKPKKFGRITAWNVGELRAALRG